MALGARPDTILISTLAAGMASSGRDRGRTDYFRRTGAGRPNLLFGVPALDPWTYAGTSLVLLLIAALACLIPARRAAWRNE